MILTGTVSSMELRFESLFETEIFDCLIHSEYMSSKTRTSAGCQHYNSAGKSSMVYKRH